MQPVNEFVNTFMQRMQTGYYDKDSQKNEGPILNDSYIEQEMKKVDKILESDIIDEVLKGVGDE